MANEAEVVVEKPKRGRPKGSKNKVVETTATTEAVAEKTTASAEAPKKRGRPAKVKDKEKDVAVPAEAVAEEPKKRGRPRKAETALVAKEETKDNTPPSERILMDGMVPFVEGQEGNEDRIFTYMSNENLKKLQTDGSVKALEKQFQESRVSMDSDRVAVALSGTLLMERQPWKNPAPGEFPISRIQYVEKNLGFSMDTLELYTKAVYCMALMKQDVGNLDQYRYDRLSAFLGVVLKGKAGEKDFIELSPHLKIVAPEGISRMSTKEFNQMLKLKYPSDTDEPDAPDLEKVTVSVSANEKKAFRLSYVANLKMKEDEGLPAPSQAQHLNEMVMTWTAVNAKNNKFIEVQAAIEAIEKEHKLLLVPIPIHQHQGMPKDVHAMRAFEVNGVLILEESQQHAAKALGVKVDDVRPKTLNITNYMVRTGLIKSEDIAEVGAENKEKETAAPAEKAEKAVKVEKPEKTEKAEKIAKAPADEVKVEKKKVKVEDLSPNQIAAKIKGYRGVLGLSEEDFAKLAEGKSPEDTLKNLHRMVKEKAAV